MKWIGLLSAVWCCFGVVSEAQLPTAPAAQLPELEALRAPYLRNLATIQSFRETKLTPLTGTYAGGLERLEKDAEARGDSATAGLAKAEQERLKTKAELTPAEHEKMNGPLRALNDRYQNDVRPILAQAQQEERKQARQYLTSLEALQRHFTGRKELGKAAIVDTERASLLPAAGLAAATPAPRLPAVSTVPSSGKLDPALADKIAEVVKNHTSTKTESSGKPGGNTDVPEGGGLLVGFEFQELKGDKGLYMRSLRPYFMTRDKLVPGIDRGKVEAVTEKVMARNGYAVAGLLTVNQARGVRVIFMKIDPVNGRLDPSPASTYMSRWIGTKVRETPIQLGGDGRFVIGVYGWTGADADTIGLIQVP